MSTFDCRGECRLGSVPVFCREANCISAQAAQPNDVPESNILPMADSEAGTLPATPPGSGKGVATNSEGDP